MLLLTVLLVTPVFALEVPALKGRVNDYGNILKKQEIVNLENRLAQYESETTNQIVILTIPSLQGQPIEDFSIKVGDAWKIGQKNKDNGVIWVICPQDRNRKIEVGKGLQGKLTDLVAGRILRETKTYFRSRNYYDGINVGLDKIMAAVDGEFKAEKPESNIPVKAQSGGMSLLYLLLAISGVIVFIALLGAFFGGGNGRRRGGHYGSGGFFDGGSFFGGGDSGGGPSGGGGSFDGGGASDGGGGGCGGCGGG
jgi:uncharacterized protein